MGIDTIASRADATTIVATWFNVIRSALNGDLVPRDSTGTATARAGSLGTETYPFLRLNIATGHWSLGDIKAHHSYNGAAPIGHGWMLCDGRVITEAAYNTEHGANTWATYVVSSALLNKYLPNLTSRYPVGVAATTQDGSGAITAVGNASHQINIQHSHTVNGHTHDMANHTHNMDGDHSDSHHPPYVAYVGGGDPASGAYVTSAPSSNTTSSTSPGTDNQLSTTQSVQPDSIQVQYYMRII